MEYQRCKHTNYTDQVRYIPYFIYRMSSLCQAIDIVCRVTRRHQQNSIVYCTSDSKEVYDGFGCPSVQTHVGLGCNSVILLRPKIGVEPPKHDVISMPTQQYTNTNYLSLERSHLVVSIMLRYMDRTKTFNDNLSCREVKIDKKFWGDLPYFALKCDKFL